jgi:hypothetical protein
MLDVYVADRARGSEYSEQSGDEEDNADSEEGSKDEESEEEGVNKHIRLLEEGDDGTDDEMEQMIRDAALRSSGSEAEDSEDEESDSEASEEAPVPARKGTQAAAKKITKAAAKAKAGDSDSSDDEDDAPVSSVFKRATVGKAGKDVLGDLQWDDSAPLVVRSQFRAVVNTYSSQYLTLRFGFTGSCIDLWQEAPRRAPGARTGL